MHYKGKLHWPPAVVWESAAPSSSAYFDQSGYKWTFSSRQSYKDTPEPSSHISLSNNPYLKRPEFWERGAEAMHIFHSRQQEKKQLWVHVKPKLFRIVI